MPFNAALVALILLGWISPAFANFGNNGMVITASGNTYTGQAAYALLVQPDGKLAVAGSASTDYYIRDFLIMRYGQDGPLDTSFNGTGRVQISISSGADEALAVIMQPDGKLVAAGYTTVGSENEDFCLVRYNRDGSLDTTFNGSGTVITSFGSGKDRATSLLLQPDGKLVAAGYAHVGFATYFALARYTPEGNLDPTFNGTGKVMSTTYPNLLKIRNLVYEPGGQLIAVGDTSAHTFGLARYQANGLLDTYFSSAVGTISFATSVRPLPNGKYLAAGGSDSNVAVVRWENNGWLDTTYDGDGFAVHSLASENDYAQGLILQPDGKAVVAGYDLVSATDWLAMDFARLHSDGSLDESFNGTGKLRIQPPSSLISWDIQNLVQQSDGKLVAAGSQSGNSMACLMVRVCSDGSLDTQPDLPVLIGLLPDHALAGQTATLDIHGWNLDKLTGVQLSHAGATLNHEALTVHGSTRATARFNLPTLPAAYDLKLITLAANSTHKTVFHSLTQIVAPSWHVQDLGKPGNPLVGPCGMAIGDADGDGASELYVANSDHQLFIYRYTGAWSLTCTAQASGQFEDVLLLDADNDGLREVYGANSSGLVYRYRWNGMTWEASSFSAGRAPLARGGLSGGWAAEMYALSGAALNRACYFDGGWHNAAVIQTSASLRCSVSGDADNNGFHEVYTAGANHAIHQHRYTGAIWMDPVTVTAQVADFTSLAIADLDQDGERELYGACLDGHLYRFTASGGTWSSQSIAVITANKIAIADGDNDGQQEIYAAGQDGHLHQVRWNSGSWLQADVGSAGTPLKALAIGDADGSHQFKIYAVGQDSHVYQFDAGPPATPTPTATATPTPVFGIRDFEGELIDPRYFYVAPNPTQGSQVRFHFLLKQAAEVEIRIYTPRGGSVLTKTFQVYPQGWNTVVWEAAGMANGVYFFVAEAKAQGITEKLKVKKLVIIK